jgi:hypothetical protein
MAARANRAITSAAVVPTPMSIDGVQPQLIQASRVTKTQGKERIEAPGPPSPG